MKTRTVKGATQYECRLCDPAKAHWAKEADIYMRTKADGTKVPYRCKKFERVDSVRRHQASAAKRKES